MTRELFNETINKKFGVDHFAQWDENTNDSIFMLKYGEYDNVYRIFAYFNDNEILVQCCGCAYYFDGDECYDEAIDFNGGNVKLMSFDDSDDWADTIERVLKMHNLVDGATTIYEYTNDDNETIYMLHDKNYQYLGVETVDGKYHVRGTDNSDVVFDTADEMVKRMYQLQ